MLLLCSLLAHRWLAAPAISQSHSLTIEQPRFALTVVQSHGLTISSLTISPSDWLPWSQSLRLPVSRTTLTQLSNNAHTALAQHSHMSDPACTQLSITFQQLSRSSQATLTSLEQLSHRAQHMNSSPPLSDFSKIVLASTPTSLTRLSSRSQAALNSSRLSQLSNSSHKTVAVSQSQVGPSLPRRDKCNGCTNAINATHILIAGYT